MIKRVAGWCRRPRSAWAIWGMVLALSVVVLWHHHRTIQLGYDTERLQTEKARLERLQRQLLIERESLASLDRIEPLARAMGLTHTPPRDAVVMRLPATSSEDGRTLVAAVGRGMLPMEAHAAP